MNIETRTPAASATVHLLPFEHSLPNHIEGFVVFISSRLFFHIHTTYTWRRTPTAANKQLKQQQKQYQLHQNQFAAFESVVFKEEVIQPTAHRAQFLRQCHTVYCRSSLFQFQFSFGQSHFSLVSIVCCLDRWRSISSCSSSSAHLIPIRSPSRSCISAFISCCTV